MEQPENRSTGPQKAVAALIGSAVTLLASFGVIVPPEWQDMATALAAGAVPVAVYLIRNKGT